MMNNSSVSDPVRNEPMSVSFSGSGFMATYQLGVVQGLRDYAPWVLRQAPKLYGASAGSLVAAAVVCGADMGCMKEDILALTRKCVFGFIPLSQLEQMLRQTLPLNAHRLANGRLHVSMTRVPDGHNILVSEFRSKEDLIRALLCSCFVPGYCGMIPPCYRGVHYIDGGLTNIQPTQDCPTLTVSPFAGDVDICPSDTSTSYCDLVINQLSVQATMPNLIRMTNALFPRDWKALNKAFYHGYQDTLFFLHRSVWFGPDWVTPMKEAVVSSKERMLPQLKFTEEEEQVEPDECPLDSPLQVVTEYSSLARVNLNYELDTLDMASNINTPAQAVEVLICNTVSYLGMISILSGYLPPRAIPYLLLPLTILTCAAVAFISRVQPWVLYFYQMVYWLWQDLKHMSWFLLSIIISSLQKSVQHRKLMSSLLQTQHVISAKGRGSPPLHLTPTIIPSLHSLLCTLETRKRYRENQQNVP